MLLALDTHVLPIIGHEDGFSRAGTFNGTHDGGKRFEDIFKIVVRLIFSLGINPPAHLFQNNPFHPSLKTHSLGGYLKDFWAISINYEHRLIFKFMKPDEVLLIDIGTHDEVY